MLEVSIGRKNKINLSDYDFAFDIKSRIFLGSLSLFELEVLEEILCCSLNIPVERLLKNLDITDSELKKALEKLRETNLFELRDGCLVVDKELRKFYDLQILKFAEDFHPNMVFLQSLLRKVPIQVLPVWYSIPRTSNNIFDSILEKYLLSPNIYERYLMSIDTHDPVILSIINMVFNAPRFEVNAEEIKDKFQLTDEVFHEYLIFLEFSLICCVSYRREDNRLIEFVTPFYEWKKFLEFEKNVQPKPITEHKEVLRKRTSPFNFVSDITFILGKIVQTPLVLLPTARESDYLLQESVVKELIDHCEGVSPDNDDDLLTWQLYFSKVIEKMCLICFAHRHEEMLCPQHQAMNWLSMEIEDRALYLYHHPHNRTLSLEYSTKLDTERNVREVEKSLEKIVDIGWVYLEDLIKSVISPIGGVLPVTLRKKGARWAYVLPTYSEEEEQFISDVIFHRLSEVGVVAQGIHQGKDCVCLTSFGRETLF